MQVQSFAAANLVPEGGLRAVLALEFFVTLAAGLVAAQSAVVHIAKILFGNDKCRVTGMREKEWIK